MRVAALVLLAAVVLCALFAPAIAPFSYEQQFRENTDAPPGGPFLLGTDEIGRDRFSRLIFATRTSLLLAPCAAAVSVLLAWGMSLLRPRQAGSALTTVCLSLPWLFLFIILRACLPLNTSPAVSVTLTFALMGLAGWAAPARVFRAALDGIASSEWMLQARAAGLPGSRISRVHSWPHVRAVALAQFRMLIPAYILSEAGLGLLGLGVAEPLPSWGNLLTDLQHPGAIAANSWVLAPLILLVLVMVCLELV